jgi:hypothetical protein
MSIMQRTHNNGGLYMPFLLFVCSKPFIYLLPLPFLKQQVNTIHITEHANNMKKHVTTAHQQHLFLNYADWRSYSKADSM